jgi:hypothetical protein
MKSLHYFIACLFLISTNIMLANAMLLMSAGTLKSSSGSLLVSLIAFLLAYMCICILIQAHTLVNFKRAFVCTFIMNLISSFVGTIFGYPLYLSVITMRSFTATNMTITEVIWFFAVILGFTIINTLLEVWIPLNLAWFDNISRKRIWRWVFVANFLSTSVYFCASLYALNKHMV